MKTTNAKPWYIYIPEAVMLFGVAWYLYYYLVRHDDTHGLYVAAPAVVLGALLNRFVWAQTTYLLKSYDWYKTNHPENVQGNKVTCFKCGSSRINIRSLLQQTYHREHFCGQCGQSLYYTPETN